MSIRQIVHLPLVALVIVLAPVSILGAIIMRLTYTALDYLQGVYMPSRKNRRGGYLIGCPSGRHMDDGRCGCE